MNHLLYISVATVEFTDLDLENLLVTARSNNELAGITGMLLFKKGTFMQMLEGEEKALRALHLRLLRDPRHRNIMILSEGSLQIREFPEWSMGFGRIDHDATSATTAGFVPLSQTAAEERSGRALRMLRRFAES